MVDVLMGVASSAAAPPLYAWASHRGCAWDRRNPSRAETAWNMTTNIRYKNRMMKSGNVLLFLLGFYSVWLMRCWWFLSSCLCVSCWCWCCPWWWWWWWSHSEDSEVRNDKLHHISQFYFPWIRFISTEINRSTKNLTTLECKLYCYILCFQITLVCSCSCLRGLTSFRQIVSHTLDWRTLFLILSAVSIILKHQSRACLEDIWSLLAVSVVLSSGRGWWCCFSLEVLSWLQEQESVCVCVWVNPEICVWRRYLCIWWSQLKQNSVNCSNYQICCWFTPKCCLTPSSITHNKTVGAIIFYLCWCINRL